MGRGEVERKKTGTRLWHDNMFSLNSNLLRTQKQYDVITTYDQQRTNKISKEAIIYTSKKHNFTLFNPLKLPNFLRIQF